MKKSLKILLYIAGILIFVLLAAFAYLNFIYLPKQVEPRGKAFIAEKTQGRVKVDSIQYIPFKGVQLKKIVILYPAKETVFSVDKVYFNARLWPLLIRRELAFRLDLYPAQAKRPLSFSGLYQIKQEKLDTDFKIISELFSTEQTILGKISALLDKNQRPKIALSLNSPQLNLQGNFFIEDNDLKIEKFSGKILQSSFDFIGEVQNLTQPLLNIYGNFDLNLAGLKDLNPEYLKPLKEMKMAGHCLGEVFISGQVSNLEAGLKMKALETLQIKNTNIDDLSILAEMKNKKASLTKLYARVYDGEINLQGECQLNNQNFPAYLNLNLFNLSLNEVIKGLTDKDTPVHGRVFSLARLQAPLKNPQAVEGKAWFSAGGTNLLELSLLKGITEVLGLPELQKFAFREASGNFFIGQQTIKTEDFKISSNNLALYFKGNMDFNGNLGFDIQPAFSQDFLLSAPNVRTVLGVFMDSAGNFLGEIKLKGNIKEPRYSFKPLSVDKIFPRAIEEGLKQFFKFKKREE